MIAEARFIDGPLTGRRRSVGYAITPPPTIRVPLSSEPTQIMPNNDDVFLKGQPTQYRIGVYRLYDNWPLRYRYEGDENDPHEM